MSLNPSCFQHNGILVTRITILTGIALSLRLLFSLGTKFHEIHKFQKCKIILINVQSAPFSNFEGKFMGLGEETVRWDHHFHAPFMLNSILASNLIHRRRQKRYIPLLNTLNPIWYIPLLTILNPISVFLFHKMCVTGVSPLTGTTSCNGAMPWWSCSLAYTPPTPSFCKLILIDATASDLHAEAKQQ